MTPDDTPALVFRCGEPVSPEDKLKGAYAMAADFMDLAQKEMARNRELRAALRDLYALGAQWVADPEGDPLVRAMGRVVQAKSRVEYTPSELATDRIQALIDT